MTPWSRRRSIASRPASRSSSATPMIPIAWPSRATSTAVRPSPASASSRLWMMGVQRPRSSKSRWLPTTRGHTATRASAPRPGNAWNDSAAASVRSRDLGAPHDRLADRVLRSELERRSDARDLIRRDAVDWLHSVTCTRPFVSVPVLSNATQRMDAVRSRWMPPLMSTPLRAAAASADTIDTGVEMTSAHGHEIDEQDERAIDPGSGFRRPLRPRSRRAAESSQFPARGGAPPACTTARSGRRMPDSGRAEPARVRRDE